LNHRVLLHPKAVEYLRKAEDKLRTRIKAALKELEDDPEKGQRLQQSTYYRLRIGDYRAIYSIDNREQRVIVLFIGHRSEVYDDFSRLV
jgi:mRNA interferase RelE/StbE